MAGVLVQIQILPLDTQWEVLVTGAAAEQGNTQMIRESVVRQEKFESLRQALDWIAERYA